MRKQELPTSHPKAYWTCIDNRKKFFDDIRLKFNIKEPRDWGKLNIKDLKQVGGATILSHTSFLETLRSTFPG